MTDLWRKLAAGARSRLFNAQISSPGALLLILPAFFWILTYSMLSLRAQLHPDQQLDVLSGKRFLSTLVGALIYWFVLRLLHLTRERSFRDRAIFLVVAMLPAFPLLLGARMLFDRVIFTDVPPTSLVQHVRWLVTWSGFFLAGIGTYLTLSSYRTINELRTSLPDLQTPPAALGEDDLWIRRNRRLVRVPIASIEWVRAEGNYVRLHSSETTGLIRMSLSALEMKLDREVFLRVHRSAICRKSAIHTLNRKPSGALVAVLSSGAEVPVGRAFGRTVAETMKRQRSGSGG